MKSRLIRNATMTVVQVLASGIVLFVLYYYLMRTIGAAQVGVWSLVMAMASLGRISELGLSGGVVKFVARYRAVGEDANAAIAVETAASATALIIAGVSLAAYPLLQHVIQYIVPPHFVHLGRQLLPFAVVCLFLSTVTGVFHAGLDGLQRTDVRSAIVVGSLLLHLILVLTLAPRFGLRGVAYAQMVQALATLLSSSLVLRRELPALRIFPLMSRRMAANLYRYGFAFQVASLAQLLFDPVTKSLLSRFSGVASVSYYEMANRMTMQCRSLLVSASQVTVPVIATMQETSPDKIRAIYRESYRLLIFLAPIFFIGLVAFAPVVSELWIGHYESMFVQFAVLLSIGWFVNVLAVPSYLSNLGTGNLRWNAWSHILTGVLNTTVGALLGMRFGAMGVLFGFVCGLIAGALLQIVKFHSENVVPLKYLLPNSWWGGALLIVGATATWSVYYAAQNALSRFEALILSCIIFALATVVGGRNDPTAAKLVGWARGMRRSNIQS